MKKTLMNKTGKEEMIKRYMQSCPGDRGWEVPSSDKKGHLSQIGIIEKAILKHVGVLA